MQKYLFQKMKARWKKAKELRLVVYELANVPKRNTMSHK